MSRVVHIGGHGGPKKGCNSADPAVALAAVWALLVAGYLGLAPASAGVAPSAPGLEGCLPIGRDHDELHWEWNRHCRLRIGPEKSTTGETFASGKYGGSDPVIAWDGRRFVAAWLDGRYGGFGQVLSLALDRNGKAISAPQQLSTGSEQKHIVDIACTGEGRCLVLWREGEASASGAVVEFSRARHAFEVVATTRLAEEITGGSLAWNGSEFFLLYVNLIGEDRAVLGLRVNELGEQVSSSPVRVSDGRGNSWPKIAWNRGAYLAVWEETPLGGRSVVNMAVINRDGQLTDGTVSRLGPNESANFHPAVTANGEGFAVVWSSMAAGDASPSVRFAAVDGNGHAGFASGLQVSEGSGSQDFPEITWSGGLYWCLWYDTNSGNENIMGRRISRGGGLVDHDVVEVAASERREVGVKAASHEGLTLAVVDSINSDFDARSERVSPVGLRDNGCIVARPSVDFQAIASEQRELEMAANQTGFIQIWKEDRIDGRGLFCNWMGPNGQARTQAGKLLDPEIDFGSGSSGVVSGPNGFLAAWRDAHWGIKAASLPFCPEDGEISVFLVPTEGRVLQGPMLAEGPGHVLVTWFEADATETRLRFCFLGGDGLVAAQGVVRRWTEGTVPGGGGVAWNGSGYCLAWVKKKYGPDAGTGIEVVFLDEEAIERSSISLDAAKSSGGGRVLGPPRIASLRGADLVIWVEEASNGEVRLMGDRLSSEGIELDKGGLVIDEGAGNTDFRCAIDTFGGGFLVGWSRIASHGVVSPVLIQVSNGEVSSLPIEASGPGFLNSAGATGLGICLGIDERNSLGGVGYSIEQRGVIAGEDDITFRGCIRIIGGCE